MTKSAVAVAEKMEGFAKVREQIHRVIVGQEEVVDLALLALLCEGHVLLEGVPGLGKTMLVRALGDCLGLAFSRIQFTPDLMPADVLGTSMVVQNEGERSTCVSSGDPSLPTCCWRMRSTAPRQKRRPPCSKRCRSRP